MNGGPAKCRSCGALPLASVISLGHMPLANRLLSGKDLGQSEPRYPLEVSFCRECSLVQITENVPPEAMFSDYAYFSSTSHTMVDHFGRLAARLVNERSLGPQSQVLEIASNDGCLLQFYKRAGVRVLGVEPARNVAEVAERERGIPTLVAFFDEDLGRHLRVEGRQADVIHAHNVLAHVPNPNQIIGGIAAALKRDGVAVIEAPYVRDLIEKAEFDTIYHEHYSYFSLHAVERLVRRHRLVVQDVERVPVHGGSLRLFIGHEHVPASSRVAALLGEERSIGLLEHAYYTTFAARVARLCEDITGEVQRARGAGGRIAAYGASAKGTILLNALGLTGNEIEFVADLSPYKQGRFMPGAHVPIVAPDELVRRRPDYTLLLVWNILDEVLAQQSEYRRLGGRFIVPIPELRIV